MFSVCSRADAGAVAGLHAVADGREAVNIVDALLRLAEERSLEHSVSGVSLRPPQSGPHFGWACTHSERPWMQPAEVVEIRFMSRPSQPLKYSMWAVAEVV